MGAFGVIVLVEMRSLVLKSQTLEIFLSPGTFAASVEEADWRLAAGRIVELLR